MIWQSGASAEVAKTIWRWVLREGGAQAAQELMITGVVLVWRLFF